MRLRNKKTGEIGELNYCGGFIQVIGIKSVTGDYTSLDELTDDWEDAPEEPKEYWGIDYTSCRKGGIEEFTYDNDNIDEFNKSIGNYFETKEEAEKAVEKLKAWKRLKDKGFRFTGITRTSFDMDCIQFEIGNDFYNEQSLINSKLNKDLVLLFSGGEE